MEDEAPSRGREYLVDFKHSEEIYLVICDQVLPDQQNENPRFRRIAGRCPKPIPAKSEVAILPTKHRLRHYHVRGSPQLVLYSHLY